MFGERFRISGAIESNIHHNVGGEKMATIWETHDIERLARDEEQIWRLLKKMAKDGGIKCTKCGDFVSGTSRDASVGVHIFLHVVIKEMQNEGKRADKVLILCDRCYSYFEKEYGVNPRQD